MAQPLFEYQQVVYIRESANLGFLEAFRIASVQTGNVGWTYSIEVSAPSQSNASFGDRIVNRPQFQRYFNESELLTLCEALTLIKANLERRLSEVNTMQQRYCSST